MIQRIQTIYLVVVTLFTSLFSFFSDYALTLWKSLSSTGLASSGLALLSSLLAFATIFLFQNRKTQLTLISLNYLLLIAALVLYIVNDGVLEFYKDWTFYPLLASFVFLLLARKGVKADENLIRSADRLR